MPISFTSSDLDAFGGFVVESQFLACDPEGDELSFNAGRDIGAVG